MLGQRHFDVQIMGGANLHMGNIAEMRTGEGKTLTCALPAYLNALAGKGVHVITVNDYLAKRDAEEMGRVHRFLGLEVGVILAGHAARRAPQAVQRGHHLRHEQRVRLRLPARQHGLDAGRVRPARPPLRHRRRGRLDPHRRGPDAADHLRPRRAVRQVVRRVRQDRPPSPQGRRGKDGEESTGDYVVDEKKRTVGILETGVEKVEDWLGIDNLYKPEHTHLVGFLNNALKAKELYKKDKDYIVVDGEVLIVDEFTGRVLHGRRYNEGMHQAIEAKEGVKIKDENQTLATITLQNYFRLYETLSGMTGTAATEANEFHQTYKLGVVPIPTNMPMIRKDQADVVYKSEDAKFQAVVQDIKERYDRASRSWSAPRAWRSPSACPRSSSAGASSTRSSTPRTTRVRRRSSPRRAASTRSPWPPTWPVEAPTSCSAATPTSVPTWSCAAAASIRPRPRRSTTRPGARRSRRPARRCRPSTTRSPSSAASTSWAPSGTSRGASTTSSAAGPDARVTRASRVSTSRSKTTSCACSTRPGSR